MQNLLRTSQSQTRIAGLCHHRTEPIYATVQRVSAQPGSYVTGSVAVATINI